MHGSEIVYAQLPCGLSSLLLFVLITYDLTMLLLVFVMSCAAAMLAATSHTGPVLTEKPDADSLLVGRAKIRAAAIDGKSVKVAAIQASSDMGAVEQNQAKFTKLIEGAAGAGAKI